MDQFFGNVTIVLLLIVTFLGMGAGGWFSTEMLKNLANIIGDKLPGSFRLGGRATWVVAAFVAIGYVFGLDINALGDFEAFDGLDAEFLQVINAALLSIGANLWHDKIFDK